MLLDYQRLTQELTPFRPSLFVQGATESDVPDAVLAAYDAPFPDETFCAGPRQLPLLMGLTPASECARLNRRTMRALATFDAPFLTAFSDGDPATRGWAESCRQHVPGAAGQRHVTVEGAGHFLQEDGGILWRTSWRVSWETAPPGLTTWPAWTPRERRPGAGSGGQRVGLGWSAGAQLRLEGGQLVVHLGVLADLVELLLNVVGAATDVLEHAGLEQLVEGARAGLHGGDLVLGPLQGLPRSR